MMLHISEQEELNSQMPCLPALSPIEPDGHSTSKRQESQFEETEEVPDTHTLDTEEDRDEAWS